MSRIRNTANFKKAESIFGEGTIVDIYDELYTALKNGAVKSSCSILKNLKRLVDTKIIQNGDDLMDKIAERANPSTKFGQLFGNDIEGNGGMYSYNQMVRVDELFICKKFQRDRSFIKGSFLDNDVVSKGIQTFEWDSITALEVIDYEEINFIQDGFGKYIMALFHPSIERLPYIVRNYRKIFKDNDYYNIDKIVERAQIQFANINTKRSPVSPEQNFDMMSKRNDTWEHDFIYNELPNYGLEYDLGESANTRMNSAFKSLQSKVNATVPKVLTYDMLHNLLRDCHYKDRFLSNKEDEREACRVAFLNSFRFLHYLIWKCNYFMLPSAEVVCTISGVKGLMTKVSDFSTIAKSVATNGNVEKSYKAGMAVARVMEKIFHSQKHTPIVWDGNTIDELLNYNRIDKKVGNNKQIISIIKKLNGNVDDLSDESGWVHGALGFDENGKYINNGMLRAAFEREAKMSERFATNVAKNQIKLNSLNSDDEDDFDEDDFDEDEE